jgi:tetratricopeptide (TPR) repeat protein
MRLPRLLSLIPAASVAACATTSSPSTPPAAGPAEVLPFIEDDYPRALAEAKARHLPLFVDASATWCHSCRYLKAYVFTDPALAKHANQFVWLSVDTEKPQNAEFQVHFPIQAWPTLLVIDPAREVATFKWLGSANAPDLEHLLDDAVAEQHPAAAPSARTTLAEADALEAAGDHAGSTARYRQALTGDLAPGERDRAIASLLGALQSSRDHAGCVQLARERVDAAQDPTLAADLAATGLACALELDAHDPSRAEALTHLMAAAQRLVPAPGLNGDDRSSLYEALCDAKTELGDPAGAHALAAEWFAFLQHEAAKATSAEARSVYDPHLVDAAIALGAPAQALGALAQTERDLPADYNAPARLALLHRELGRYPEALADTDRAMAKVYGPRTLRILEIRASVFEKMGDAAQQKQTLDRAVAFAQALPAGQRSDRTIARLQALREKVGP